MRFSVEPSPPLPGLLADWTALYARAARPSFFLSPAWIAAWLAGRPARTELFLLRGVIGGDTMLLGLFGRSARRHPPIVGGRAIHLHEFGEPDLDAIYIEYNDFLVAAEAAPDARAKAIQSAIAAFSKRDDVVFRNASPALASAIDATGVGRLRRELGRRPVFEVDLARVREAGGSFAAIATGSFRSQLRRSMRRYEERGALTLRVAQTDAARERAWRKLAELHRNAWRRRGKQGAFDNPAFEKFHRRLRAEAPESTQFVELKCGEETIGCLYNFVHDGRVMNYQSGFRFEDDNQLKPGFVAHALAIEHYASQGFAVYDLLAGDAPYKRRLGEESVTLSTVVLEGRNGLRSTLRAAARKLRNDPRRRAG